MLSTIFCNFRPSFKISTMLQKIKYWSGNLFLLLFCLLFIPDNILWSQTDPEAKAKELFDAGQYEEALPVFRELIRLYPNDENLNYYLGACLSETNQFTDETKRALDIAKKEIPESYFYLGKYFHIRSDWKNAIRNYEQFKSDARKKSVKASSVGELLAMCRAMKNPFHAVETQPADNFDTLSEKIKTPEVVEPVFTEVPEALKDSLIRFQVNAVISYNKINQFKFESSKEAFVKGWLIEQELRKKLDEISNLRKQYGTLVGPRQDSLVDRILKLEQKTYQMNQQALNAYQEANLKEAEYWSKAGALEVQDFRREITRIQDSVRTVAEERMRGQEEEKLLVILPDTAVIDTLNTIQPPPGNQVVYKIQIGAYRNSPPQWVQGQFKKLAVIRRIDQHVDEKGVTVYTVGELKSYDDAVQMQKQIRMEGMKNAFIAAYKDDKRISLEEARKLTEQ